VNSRWGPRIALIIVLLMFFFLMMNLQRQLLQLQRTRKPPATSTR